MTNRIKFQAVIESVEEGRTLARGQPIHKVRLQTGHFIAFSPYYFRNERRLPNDIVEAQLIAWCNFINLPILPCSSPEKSVPWMLNKFKDLRVPLTWEYSIREFDDSIYGEIRLAPAPKVQP